MLPLSVAVLLLAMAAGVLWGTAEITWSERLAILLRSEDAPRGLSMIVWQWRIPRVLAVGMIGAGLTLISWGCHLARPLLRLERLFGFPQALRRRWACR